MKQELLAEIIKINAVKLGQFELKSGDTSPIYIDLRRIISYPTLLMGLTKELLTLSQNLSYDYILGVPYTGIPFSTLMSVLTNKPQILMRKEPKEYGLRRMIEGEYTENKKVLVLDDLISRGTSKTDAVKLLNQHNLNVEDIIVLIDRRISKIDIGLNIYSVFSMEEVVEILRDTEKVSPDEYRKLIDYLKENENP